MKAYRIWVGKLEKLAHGGQRRRWRGKSMRILEKQGVRDEGGWFLFKIVSNRIF